MERPNNTQRDRKCSMPWKVRVGLLLFFIGFPIYLATGVYVLRDDTCGVDKVSLEKRCQKALDHYRGKQVNL